MAALLNIGGVLCWMLVRKSRQCRCCDNFGSKKTVRRSQQLQGRPIRSLAVVVRKTRSLTHLFQFFNLLSRFQNYTSSESHQFGRPHPFTGLPVWEKWTEVHYTLWTSVWRMWLASVKIWWSSDEEARDSGQNVAFWKFRDFQEVAKVHHSQQSLRRGPLYSFFSSSSTVTMTWLC